MVINRIFKSGKVEYTTEDTLSEEHFKNGNKQTQLQTFNEYFDIWNEERFVISDEKRKSGEIIFKFYRNCFRYNEINLRIQDIFNSHSEILILTQHIVMVIHLILMRMAIF